MLAQRAGGWPLTMFLTPEGSAVLRRHLFPAAARATACRLSRPAASASRRSSARSAPRSRRRTSEVLDALARSVPRRRRAARRVLAPTSIGAMLDNLRASFDAQHGGFGGAPKFPHPTDLALCLRKGEQRRSRGVTLRAHGRRRHLRPARRRLLPLQHRWHWTHPALREDAVRQRAAPRPARRCLGAHARAALRALREETAGWVMREMQSPQGGYYSSLDADSEHEEGKFYVWTRDEVARAPVAGRIRRGRAALRPRPAAELREPALASARRPRPRER